MGTNATTVTVMANGEAMMVDLIEFMGFHIHTKV